MNQISIKIYISFNKWTVVNVPRGKINFFLLSKCYLLYVNITLYRKIIHIMENVTNLDNITIYG